MTLRWGKGGRGGAVRRNWNHPGDFDVIARIQTVSWSKFKCFGGLDKRVQQKVLGILPSSNILALQKVIKMKMALTKKKKKEREPLLSSG